MGKIIFRISAFFVLINCGSPPTVTSATKDRATNVYDLYMDSLIADGFDYPFGDGNGGGDYIDKATGTKHSGWYIATKTAEVYALGVHTGEDWNGKGGGNTDLGQDVFSTAKGKVIAAQDFGAPWGNIVMIQHRYIENNKVDTVYSVYMHLSALHVKENDIVDKRQLIGNIGDGGGSYPAHLHFEIRRSIMKDIEPAYWPSSHGYDSKWVLEHYCQPSKFVDAHRNLVVPKKENSFIFVTKENYKLHYFEKGILKYQYDIGLSQIPLGHKQKQGDLKLPEGMYYIVEKAVGPFTGAYSSYLGPRWMKLSYPNIYDAKKALDNKIIDNKTFTDFAEAWKDKTCPPQNTALGGGIGIHGWNGDWPHDTKDLTWGCISMRNRELINFYNMVKPKTCVIIVP